MRLSPLDPLIPLWRHFISLALYWVGNYAEAGAAGRSLCRAFPDFRLPYYTLIAALGQLGNVAEAQAVMNDALAKFGEAFRTLMRLPPELLLEFRSDDRERLIDGFRKAGLA